MWRKEHLKHGSAANVMFFGLSLQDFARRTLVEYQLAVECEVPTVAHTILGPFRVSKHTALCILLSVNTVCPLSTQKNGVEVENYFALLHTTDKLEAESAVDELLVLEHRCEKNPDGMRRHAGGHEPKSSRIFSRGKGWGS